MKEQSKTLVSKKDFLGYIIIGIIYGIVFIMSNYFDLTELLSFVKKNPKTVYGLTLFSTLLLYFGSPNQWNILRLFIRQNFIMTLIFSSTLLILEIYVYIFFNSDFIMIKNSINYGFCENCSFLKFFITLLVMHIGFIYFLYYMMTKKKV